MTAGDPLSCPAPAFRVHFSFSEFGLSVLSCRLSGYVFTFENFQIFAFRVFSDFGVSSFCFDFGVSSFEFVQFLVLRVSGVPC